MEFVVVEGCVVHQTIVCGNSRLQNQNTDFTFNDKVKGIRSENLDFGWLLAMPVVLL